ncbi:FAD-binding oxidoreductase [Paraburkholderia acidisoli]|uniref:FAD-binding protein n=1 Tax=Paraburkholderia acidisoli TaxID=2571748 RepID=A0A7Z2GPK2_9BURK|nr:FAD-binding oxidoreductase [Paraburkholderia acidisoli]QGZ65611.1 FAD-binding protein [Paraburkholderia acidisoli]
MQASPPMSLHDALAHALGADRLNTDPAFAEAQAGDWSDAPRCAPPLVILPRTPEEVARALAVLAQYRQPLVVQGGLTGLAGAATPQPGEVALSLARLTAIEAFDTVGGTVTVQAGIVLESLQTQVEAAGWFFPLDLGARGSCQLGGNAATNAGGNRVLRFGTMRERILGLEVALPDGTVLSMLNRTTKNTTGIDLKQLFIGAEGTLGVITRLVLKLEPKPAAAQTALCALGSFDAAAQLLKALRMRLPALSSFELMWDDFMVAAGEVAKLKPPFSTRYPVYALVETLGDAGDDAQQALEAALGDALEHGTIDDVIVAQSLEQAKQLWAARESVGELLAATRPHAAFDVGVPMDEMERLVATLRARLEARFAAQRHLFFGHLGDGNLHLLSGPYEAGTDLLEVEALVYEAVRDAGGCISAEHGIGVVKQAFLGLTRSEPELDLMRKIKQLVDPAGILNGRRVVPDRDTSG